MKTREQIIHNLKIAMVTKGYNATQLAEHLGVSKSYVGSVLSGKASPEKVDDILSELGFELNVSLVKIE